MDNTFLGLFFMGMDALAAAMQLSFVCRFMNCTRRPVWLVLYGVIFICGAVLLPGFDLPYSFVLLWLAGFIVCRRDAALTASASILSLTVWMLAYGILNSVQSSVAPILLKIKFPFMPQVSMLFSLLALLIVMVVYNCIFQCFSTVENLESRYFFVFLMPILLVLLVEQYISGQIYGNTVITVKQEIIWPKVHDGAILAVHVFAGVCLFSVLYACKKLAETQENRMHIALLEQETQAQACYVQEARAREAKTRAFRHDIHNHILALLGLLQKNEIHAAILYLRKLHETSDALSAVYQTGNTVVDSLLGSKLSAAKQQGIQVECAVKIMPFSEVDDLDWCVIFSNAVDNAMKACSRVDRDGYLHITGRHKGSFFLLEVENSSPQKENYPKGQGIGLRNLEAVARKYHGAVTTEERNGVYRLHVLLVISRSLDNIPVKGG